MLNESAAYSLMECFEELLTLHCLQVPASLRKTLYTTNPIESMFSTVRGCERNIKRPRGSTMLQRWLAAVLLHCEKKFRRVKGHRYINQVMANIDAPTRRSRNQKGCVSAARESVRPASRAWSVERECVLPSQSDRPRRPLRSCIPPFLRS